MAAYRALIEEWKLAGRAGKKSVDDQLWERFKAAGDALYAAKKEAVAREDGEYSANLEAKLALLAEAESILRITDRRQAPRTAAGRPSAAGRAQARCPGSR